MLPLPLPTIRKHQERGINPVLTEQESREVSAEARDMTVTLSDHMNLILALRYVLRMGPDETGALVAPRGEFFPPPLPDIELSQRDCQQLISAGLRQIPENRTNQYIGWRELGLTDLRCIYFGGIC